MISIKATWDKPHGDHELTVNWIGNVTFDQQSKTIPGSICTLWDLEGFRRKPTMRSPKTNRYESKNSSPKGKGWVVPKTHIRYRQRQLKLDRGIGGLGEGVEGKREKGSNLGVKREKGKGPEWILRSILTVHTAVRARTNETKRNDFPFDLSPPPSDPTCNIGPTRYQTYLYVYISLYIYI